MIDNRHGERESLEDLLDTLTALRAGVHEEGQELFQHWCPRLRRRAALLGSLNLAYYLALRRRDLRPVQAALSLRGLSSLGRSEGRVLPSMDAIIATLQGVLGGETPAYPSFRRVTRGQRLLRRETEAVFGPAPGPRQVRILVTLPPQAASDPEFILDLARRGMNAIRINCAKDDPDTWAAMIAHTRRAEAETGRPCRIYMDLGGPRPRTGAVQARRRIRPGDSLHLTRKPPKNSDQYPFQAACTLPDILEQVAPGAPAWIDDGRIGLVVEQATPDGLLLRVTHGRPKGEKLRPDMGMNFPGSALRVSPLTPDDLAALDFIAGHADIVGYSFVQEAADIALLQDELARRMASPRRIAIVAKMENARAIRNLPEIIVQGAGQQPFGVLIARGDLAVELGYERLAEMQEELLWMCEAASVPVIWATQVLDKFVRRGTLSRSEMTDAAMAGRAECVMLNKGAYVADAVGVLDDVLTRMQAHQSKKTPRLRALQSWTEFVSHGRDLNTG